MKKITPKKAKIICSILYVLAAFVSLTAWGSDTSATSYVLLGIAVVILVAGFTVDCIFYRCPNCGHYLGKTFVKYCPDCGIEIKDTPQ